MRSGRKRQPHVKLLELVQFPVPTTTFCMTSVLDRGAPLFDHQRDYNHATDSSYKSYRAQADESYKKKNKLSQQSQEAYKRGDKQRAHELSEQLKAALQEAEFHNRQAAEFVFRENNADSAGDEIDLHGLYVKEAEWILQKRIGECIRTGQSHLKVIVGKGLHSQNGVAKLKPAIDDMCDETGLKHYIDSKNQGVLVIDFANSGNYQIPNSWDTSPFGQQQPQYQQQQQPQYQQQNNYQQQQGHNQQQDIKTGNSLVDALLKIVCGCLNSK